MSTEREDWAEAFLRQGTSDLRVYDLLAGMADPPLPRSHALHYLQMTCEKLAKAYRIRDTTAGLHGDSGLLRRHVGFSKFMSAFLLSPAVRSDYSGRTSQLEEVRRRVLALAREIEKVARPWTRNRHQRMQSTPGRRATGWWLPVNTTSRTCLCWVNLRGGRF